MSTSMYTSDIYDELGDAVDSLALSFENLGGRRHFQGPARTVRCRDDNALLKELMRTPGKGAVLVVDGGGSMATTLLGGNMAAAFAENGWSGVIIYGAIRDRHELGDVDVGVLAIGSNPKRSRKEGVGEVDVDISIGGVTISPGVMIYADSDGVLVGR